MDAYKWLTTNSILATFFQKKKDAKQQYRAFVKEGRNQPKPWENLKNQIYLGDDNFVDEMQCKILPGTNLSEVPSSEKTSGSKTIVVL